MRIVHVDIDAFFASVEEIDNPDLVGKPMVVGGRSQRGVITTANYEAREYGLHSAMPIFMAKNLCPHVIIVPGRMNRYKEMSQRVFSILRSHTSLIEKVSIDEAYLDITNLKLDKIKFCYDLKLEIKNKTGLNISCGLSYNKFLAKLGSEWNKPDGFKYISEKMVPEILMPLDISKVHGIGKKSENKLRAIGINKVKDLYNLNEEFLVEMFGKFGHELFYRIRGIDKRKVEPIRDRKSMGVERTFIGTSDEEQIRNYIHKFSEELSQDFIKYNLGANTLTLKLKTEDFKVHTISKTFLTLVFEKGEIEKIALDLYESIKPDRKIRLLGISGSNLIDLNTRQLNFLGGL